MRIKHILTKLFSKVIGEDEFGNQYYILHSKNSNGKYRRLVLYKGIEEPTKVPPMWHAWLHYVTDNIPNNFGYKWQKKHLPNLTGSSFCYKPHSIEYPNERNNTKFYQAWNPRYNNET